MFHFGAGVYFIAPRVPFPNACAGGLERHDAQLELARLFARPSALAGLEGVLRHRHADQHEKNHKTGGQRGHNKIARHLARNGNSQQQTARP